MVFGHRFRGTLHRLDAEVWDHDGGTLMWEDEESGDRMGPETRGRASPNTEPLLPQSGPQGSLTVCVVVETSS